MLHKGTIRDWLRTFGGKVVSENTDLDAEKEIYESQEIENFIKYITVKGWEVHLLKRKPQTVYTWWIINPDEKRPWKRKRTVDD